MASEKKEDEIDIEEIKKMLVSTATRLQQECYVLSSDWDEFDPKRPNILKNWIGAVLFGPPQADENETLTVKDTSSAEDSLFVYKPAKMKKIDSLYEKIVEHGTQNTADKKILCGKLYNEIFYENSIKAIVDIIHKEDDFSLMEYVSQYPIFKVLKNITKNIGKERKTIKIENYYIDDSGRVYKSWKDYLESNVLPPCVMVVPYGGEYQGDERDQWTDEMSYVWVEIHESPACSKKILNALDTSSTFLSLGGMALSIAAAFTPVGAAVAVAGGLGMGVSAVWTIGRSSQELVDRSKHDQSINVTNKDGFTCWFGIASSALSVASTGGSVLLSRAIKNGTTISKTAQTVHDGVQIGTLAVTGVSAVSSFYNICDTYKENQTISAQEVLNFAATILILGNSVVNMKLSRTIIESQQNSIIKDYKDSLRSNRHRKEFEKMIKNTKSIISDPTTVKEHTIRGINKISNKDEFFASILRSKKSLASEGIKPAFVEGKFLKNGKTLMNPVDFVKGMTHTSKSTNSVVIKPLIIPSTSTGLSNVMVFKDALGDFLKRYAKELTAFLKPKISQFVYVLTDIDPIDKPDVIFFKLLSLALKIIVKMAQEEYPVTNLLVKAVDFLWDYIKANIRGKLTELGGNEQSREILIKVLINLYPLVEDKLDEWVASFREYLREKLMKVEDGVKNACRGFIQKMSNDSSAINSETNSGTLEQEMGNEQEVHLPSISTDNQITLQQTEEHPQSQIDASVNRENPPTINPENEKRQDLKLSLENTYSAFNKGPFSVIVQSGAKSFHHISISRLLHINFSKPIKNVTKYSRNSAEVEYYSREDANEIVNSKELLKSLNLRAYIPNFRISRKGIVVVPASSDCEILKGAKTSNGATIREIRSLFIKDKRRLKRMVFTFEGQELPEYIQVFGTRASVSLYVEKVKICFNCWRFGHFAGKCTNPRCAFCGKKPHEGGTACPQMNDPPRCLNCQGNHLSKDSNCPRYKEQQHINKIAAFRNLSSKDASTLYYDEQKRSLDNNQDFDVDEFLKSKTRSLATNESSASFLDF